MSSSPPLVTVALPTRNRAGYLRQTLESVLAQQHAEMEILVSDNASTDETAETVAAFDDPRIHYRRHESDVGMAGNWNGCVSEARGDWFLLLSDDDLLDPDFLSSCVGAAADRTAGVVRTGTRVIDAGGRVTGEAPNGAAGLSDAELFRAWFAGRTSFFLCSTLYATRPLQELGGFSSPRDLALDVRTTLLLGSREGRADVPEVKASYRYQPGSASNAARVEDWLEDSLDLLELMCELAPAQADAIRREGRDYFARRNYDRAAAIDSLPERWRTLLAVRRRCGVSTLPPLGAFAGTSGALANRLRAFKRGLHGDAS